MTTNSAGLVLFRRSTSGTIEVLIAHMGGPFWAKKDDGAWSFPKGEFDPATEAPFEAARREFAEELGFEAPILDSNAILDLGEVAASGKRIHMYAYETDGDFDLSRFEPGTFEMEWPPRSGRRQPFPEVDRIAWFGLDVAIAKLTKAQGLFIARLLAPDAPLGNQRA